MRQILSITLALVFLSQSTGVGIAVEEGRPGHHESFLADLRNAMSGLANLQLLAMVLTPDRYAAMHAPRPTRVTVEKSDPSKTIQRGLVRPGLLGGGMRGTPPTMLNRPLLSKDAEKLPAPALGTGSSPTSSSLSFPAGTSHANTSLVRPSSAGVVQAPTIDSLLGRTQIPLHRATPRGSGIRPMDVSIGSANLTGINPWWTYEEGALPGVGKYMVNVANGNLIVQSTDVDVPERGIDLAFVRTYNSDSQNDWNASGQNDDGSPNPNVYGLGWTNTFDAHVANNTSGGISVFDIDGARYDYTPNGTGCPTPPPGVYNQLCTDGGNGWLWYKKSGTIYYFYGTTSSQANAGYSGRLFVIWARNQNNRILLTYTWANGDASSSSNLTQIVAQHSDGQSLTLNFGTFNGAVLLASLTRPDGQQINYLYNIDYSGNFNIEVDLPGNNQGTLRQGYGYLSATNKLAFVASPRWTMSNEADGAYVWFNYFYGNYTRLTSVSVFGYANPVPNDGTNTAIQPNYSTAYQNIAYTAYSYPSSGQTSMTDADGHASIWNYDTSSRVTQTQEWTGAIWLATNASWDSSNNLTESVDARGNATDYAYDSNGNTVAVALPAVSTNQGTFRPTSLYSYDRTNGANNVVQYCDPVETHALGADWTSNPGTNDSLCPNQSGTTRYTWDYGDASEPFGRLSNSYTPLGYHESYAYSVASQGGVDAGLPTSVTGDGFSQLDGIYVTPQQTISYDSLGNAIAYNTGNGAWSASYDSLNRRISATDPDNVTSRTCYYANGALQATQSAAQYALDGGPCGTHSIGYTYDADGNELTETHHYSGGNDATHKWYDGEDRLVEVQAPGGDSTKWARYRYDLSQGGTVSIDGSSPFKAYGNLFATAVNGGPWPTSRGQAFDALDRNTVIYRYKPTGGIYQTTSAYDTGASTYGLLATTTDGLNEITSYTYDAAGRTTNISFQNDGGVTPARAYVFDANGRPTLITSSNGAKSYVYDSAGRLASTAQTNTGFTGSTISYDYYPNGWRSDLNVSGPYVSQSQLLKYSYRADGERDAQVFSYGGNSWQFSWGLTAAGRETSFADPFYARQKTYDAYGRLASDTLEQGAYTGFSYNPEDGVTGYAAFRGQTASLSYDANNELTGEGFAPGGDFWPNGTPGSGGAPCTTTALVCDALNGAAISQSDSGDDWTRSKNWSYDNAGRQNVQTGTYHWSGPCSNPLHPEYDDLTCYNDIAASKSNGFDAENHLIGTGGSLLGGPALETCQPPEGHGTSMNPEQPTPPPAPPVTPSIFYGPDGHVVEIGGEQIYWDDDQPLFTAANGALDDIKVDGFAVYSASRSQIAILDRDFSGTQVSQHNGTGYDQWGPESPYHASCATTPAVAGSAGYTTITELVSQPGTDGIYSGGNTFQGARAYDPATQQWTAPDAYAGDVHDPMSQRPYMWNHNNPLGYSDPTGYVSQTTVTADNQVHIDIYVLYAGDKDSKKGKDAIARFEQQTIEALSGKKGDYKVSVTFHNASDAPSQSLVNTITIGDEDAPSMNNNGSDQWTIGTSYPDKGLAHEGGHVVGLPDEYDRLPNGHTKPKPGWENNLMSDYGPITERNIQILVNYVKQHHTSVIPGVIR